MSTHSLLYSFTQTQNIHIATSVFLLAMLLTGLAVRRRHTGQPLVKYAIYWIFIIACMVFIYSFKDDFQAIKQRFLTALLPASAVQEGRELSLKRSSNRHFMVYADVNGHSVKFLIDTGATSVVLSKEDARRVGINTGAITYNREVQTANGVAFVAESRVSIAIGEFVVEDFPVLISAADGMESLLGMSLLNQFKSFNISDDTMRLEY